MLKKMRLRDKMTLWYTALTFLMVVTFACMLTLITGRALRDILEQEARLSMTQIIAQIESERGMLTFENEVPLSSTSMYYITEANGSELASYGKDITLFDQYPAQENAIRTVQGADGQWLLLDSSLVQVDHFTFRVRVAVSCEHNNRVLFILTVIFVIGIPLITLVALAGGFVIAKRSLRPIRQIIRSARIIAGGDLSERIPNPPAPDELGELTDTLNQMLANVDTAFQREKRFSSDASHELRMPVTVIRAYAESMLAKTGAEADRHTAMQSILDECGHMQKIINQLLMITRGQEGRYAVSMEPVPLEPICTGVAETLADSLVQRGQTLTVSVPQELTFTADQSLLTEMLLNLVENAIKYGKPNGHIEIRAAQKEGRTILTIQDDGIGIPREALPHIFERFYRVDVARDRSGSGLGLSIVQWIVQAHQATVQVESELGKGTAITVEFPCLS
ncbi:MAG TPA: ATP-binding protein [Candidatus Limiplasma sp.]|nr:ATP-binding protein [Candidatus Limiplasma sp.]HPS81590.1 ATP-binding protein [Candidatus Limiplasma sp.]